MFNGRRRGGTLAGGGQGGIVTVRIRPMVAICEANQEALDRLQDLRIKAEQNPNSKFIFTIKRAMKSLQDCKQPINTLQEALDLKYVGDRIAKIIVPHAAAKPAAPKPAAPKSQQELTRRAAEVRRETEKKRSVQTTLSSNPTEKASKPKAVSQKERAYTKAKAHAENLNLPEGPWKVVLLIDGREHNSKLVVARCRQSGIPCEERNLPIGDMAWIARCDPDGQGHSSSLEIMLGTIMERKEVADFASSIFGTRFHEQRLRLKQSGLSQVLYLVEGDLNSQANCPAETMRMAMMETRVQLGFSVLETLHLNDTVQLLKGLHRRIVQRTFPDAFSELPTYQSRGETTAISQATGRPRKRRRPTSLLEMVFDTRPVPPFDTTRFITYPELKTKVERDREAGTKTVGAIYQAMLKQIPTLSQKKCQAIAREYPTLHSLMTAYETSSNPAALLRDVTCDRQRLGAKSSAETHIACCTRSDGTLQISASGITSTRPQHQHDINMPSSSQSSQSSSFNPYLKDKVSLPESAEKSTMRTVSNSTQPSTLGRLARLNSLSSQSSQSSSGSSRNPYLKNKNTSTGPNCTTKASTVTTTSREPLKSVSNTRNVSSTIMHSSEKPTKSNQALSFLDLTADTPPRHVSKTGGPSLSQTSVASNISSILAAEDDAPHLDEDSFFEQLAAQHGSTPSNSQNKMDRILANATPLGDDAASVDTFGFQTPFASTKKARRPTSNASLRRQETPLATTSSSASRGKRHKTPTMRQSLGDDSAPLFSSPAYSTSTSGGLGSSQESQSSSTTVQRYSKDGDISPVAPVASFQPPRQRSASSVASSTPSSASSSSTDRKKQVTIRPATTTRDDDDEDSIIVLDSSSDEDEDSPARKVPAPLSSKTTTTTTAATSTTTTTNSASSDLQSRVAALLGRETITIDSP